MDVIGIMCLLYVTYLTQYSRADEANVRQRYGVKNKACIKDDDCIENAVCSHFELGPKLEHQICICEQGFVMFRNKTGDVCLKEATKLGDACLEDIQCAAIFGAEAICKKPFARATRGVCECKPGAELVNSLCEAISKIGDSCVVTDNCPVNVYCERSVCVCPYNHVPNSDRTRCIKNSNLGEACNEDRNCLNTNSRCYEGNCRCSGSHVKSESGNMCLKLADNLHDQCSEDDQCRSVSPSASCFSGSCECKSGYHAVGDVCWTSIGLGEYCSDSRQCISNSNITALMHCHNTRCACVPGSVGDKKLNECVQDSSSSSLLTGSCLALLVCLFTSLILHEFKSRL